MKEEEEDRGPDDARSGDPGVRPGLEVLLGEERALVEGRRLGLITNPTGVDRSGRSGIDRLSAASGVRLTSLFSPEHGLRGESGAEEEVGDAVDPRTGLPVYSLYGDSRRPSPEALERLDVLAFDIQDVGARYYTYVSTMALAMEAAAERGVRFLVLDRPNPLGGHRVQGNVLDPAYSSFVGTHPVAMRHGMTPGELARMYDERFDVGADLRVVPARGWEREMWYDRTGLPWVPPSPGMRDLETATHYPGTCLFEGTRLSVGRGTGRTFRQVGAPWIDPDELAGRVNGRGLAGLEVEPVAFTPRDPVDGRFDGRRVLGIRFRSTDRESYDPTEAGLAALLEARRLSGDEWGWRPGHFDRLAGTDRLRRSIERGERVAEITDRWRRQREAFRSRRDRHLLY